MVKMKKGIIVGVHDEGSIWTIDVAEGFSKGKPKGKITTIRGDWRPMRDGLDDAFDISSDEFPYTSKQKIYENVIGEEIKYTPEDIFGASIWIPTYKKKFSLKVDKKGKIKKLKEVI